MDTRAEKPTLQHLPAEILSAIIGNLSSNEDITSFRLTCRKVGNDAASKASLYRKVHLCLHPWSRTRFELIAFNKIPGRAGDYINSSSRVKDLIFEDIRVLLDLSKFGVDLSGCAKDQYLISQLGRFEYQLYYNPSGVDTIGAAAKQLNALETIEYDPGSTRVQRPMHSHQLSGNAYIDPEAGYEELLQSKVQEIIEKETWESRSRYFLPLSQRDAIHATRHMFCKVVGSVLQTCHPRAKPLTVRICSPVPRFFNPIGTYPLYSNSTRLERYPEWPRNNRLHNLELRYTSSGMFKRGSVMPDLGVLCRDLNHGQFANLRSLTLGGNGIYGLNFLNIDVLGEDGYTLDCRSLEKLRLENVCVSVRTISWLRRQKLHLEIHNAIWRYHSFLEFPAGNMLYTAKLTGIHWRYDILNNDALWLIAVPPSLYLHYYLFPPKAWIVAESSTEAEKVVYLDVHQPHCSIPWNPKQRWVEQERVEQYILQGGTDPMTEDNMCCDNCQTWWPWR
jgi:hypothetical protein